VLDVRVAGREPGAVTITARPDDPADLGVGSAPTDGGVTLTLAVPASVTPSTHTLHLRAEDGTTVVQRDVRVDVQGVPCHLDRGFADAGIAALPIDGAPSALVTTADAITLATPGAIARLTAGGELLWSAPSPHGSALALAVDDGARTFVVAPAGVFRLGSDGIGDASFGAKEQTPTGCSDVALVGGAAVVLCGSGTGGWLLYRLDEVGATVAKAHATAAERCTPKCIDAKGTFDPTGADAVSRGRTLLPINAVVWAFAVAGIGAGTFLVLTSHPKARVAAALLGAPISF